VAVESDGKLEQDTTQGGGKSSNKHPHPHPRTQPPTPRAPTQHATTAVRVEGRCPADEGGPRRYGPNQHIEGDSTPQATPAVFRGPEGSGARAVPRPRRRANSPTPHAVQEGRGWAAEAQCSASAAVRGRGSAARCAPETLPYSAQSAQRNTRGHARGRGRRPRGRAHLLAKPHGHHWASHAPHVVGAESA
jgi:hypothetical protein